MANEELQSLLNTMAQRLGCQPEDLKASAQSGDFSQMLSSLSANDAARVQKVLSDRDAAARLLSSPQAQDLLRRLTGGNGK